MKEKFGNWCNPPKPFFGYKRKWYQRFEFQDYMIILSFIISIISIVIAFVSK